MTSEERIAILSIIMVPVTTKIVLIDLTFS